MLSFVKVFSVAVVLFAIAVAFVGSHKPATKMAAAAPVITLQKFYALEDGMSYEDAVSLLGDGGVVVSRSVTPGVPGYMDPLTTVMVQWTNPGIFAGNMNAMFQNDRLISKAQFGLR